MKVLERICLLLWIISVIGSVSCLGLACMVYSINAIVSYFHWGQEQVAFQGQPTWVLFVVGLLTVPFCLFIQQFGNKYLHFREHDDGIDYEDEDEDEVV